MLRPNVRRWLDRAGFVGLTAWAFAQGGFVGLQLMVFRLDLVYAVLVIGMLNATFTSIMFAATMGVSALILLAQEALDRRRGEPEPTDDVVTAIVPVYRDGNVLDVSVRSLLSSSQPVEVYVVCEPDDPGSLRRAEELAADDRVSVLVNDRYAGTKAGAINYALEETDGEYVGVFDADERVHPEFLAGCVGKLQDCDVVQGRTVPRGDGLVESLAYCESVLLSYAGRRGLYLFTGFRMAASRALVARREAIEAVGGYDPAMVTEDFEFAYRCYKHRLDVREQLRYPSSIDAAHTLRDWWGQRKRWMTGYAQVFERQIRSALRPSDYRDVLSAAICGGTVVGSMLLLGLVPKFLLLFVFGTAEMNLLPALTVVGISGYFRYRDVGRGVVDEVGFWWLLVPLLLPIYGLAVAKALPEYLFSWDGDWYHAEKEA